MMTKLPYADRRYLQILPVSNARLLLKQRARAKAFSMQKLMAYIHLLLRPGPHLTIVVAASRVSI